MCVKTCKFSFFFVLIIIIRLLYHIVVKNNKNPFLHKFFYPYQYNKACIIDLLNKNKPRITLWDQFRVYFAKALSFAARLFYLRRRAGNYLSSMYWFSSSVAIATASSPGQQRGNSFLSPRVPRHNTTWIYAICVICRITFNDTVTCFLSQNRAGVSTKNNIICLNHADYSKSP